MSEKERPPENGDEQEEKFAVNQSLLFKEFGNSREFEDAKFFVGNYAEHPDLSKFIKFKNVESNEEQKSSKKGSHREVIFYNNYVFKSPENMDAKSAMEIQENMPDVPIVRYIGAVKDLKTNKEYLIEPKGEQFDELYLASDKSQEKREKFAKMLDEFISGFRNKNKIPYEFTNEDLDNHLLVFTKGDKRILEMTDVLALKEIKSNKEIENISKDYLYHLDVLSKSKPSEEALKEKDLNLIQQEEKFKINMINIKETIHHIMNELTGIYGYIGLLDNPRAEDKAGYVDFLREAIKDIEANKKGLFDKLDFNVTQLIKKGELEDFRNYEKQIISDYDGVLYLTSLAIEGNSRIELLNVIMRLIDIICIDIKQSWNYVKDEYNIKKIDEEEERKIKEQEKATKKSEGSKQAPLV
jgi:hypothetical protein